MVLYKNRRDRLLQDRGRGVARAYESWCGMKRRCKHADPSRGEANYANISVCERWADFDAFLQDMGEAPDGMTIDRIDSKGNYEPSNCRWADATTQSRNRAYVKLSEQKAAVIRGLYAFSRITQQELAAKFGVSQRTISLVVRNEHWV